MKLWVFKKDDGEVIFISEEKERGLIYVYSLNNMNVVVREEYTWKHIDELKAQGKLFYIDTIRALRVSEEFFFLIWWEYLGRGYYDRSSKTKKENIRK